MKTNFKDRSTKASWKNFLVVFLLINITGLSYNALAGDIRSLINPLRPISNYTDTVKMIAGVPLKPEDISPLLIGESIPVLKLPKASGESFDLNRSVSETPTILVFYRGGWCPYCSKQLGGLQEIEKDLIKLGYQIIAISTDSPDNLGNTIDKQKLSYTLLSDADLNAAKRFGIAFKSPKNYDKFLPETSGGKNIDKQENNQKIFP